jgi:hypothetical protein
MSSNVLGARLIEGRKIIEADPFEGEKDGALTKEGTATPTERSERSNQTDVTAPY